MSLALILLGRPLKPTLLHHPRKPRHLLGQLRTKRPSTIDSLSLPGHDVLLHLELDAAVVFEEGVLFADGIGGGHEGGAHYRGFVVWVFLGLEGLWLRVGGGDAQREFVLLAGREKGVF